MEVYLHSYFTSTLDGGEWSASRPGIHCVGLRSPVGRGGGEKKNPCPSGNQTPIVQSLYRLSYGAHRTKI